MIIGTSALEQLVSRAVVGRKTVDEVSQDAFSAVAAAGLNSGTAPVVAQTSNSTSQDSKQDNSGYNESFARMMINLKSAGDTSLSEKTADRDNGVIGSVANTTSANDVASTGSVEQKFMDSLKQTAEEKVREKLTGVSQKDYDAWHLRTNWQSTRKSRTHSRTNRTMWRMTSIRASGVSRPEWWPDRGNLFSCLFVDCNGFFACSRSLSLTIVPMPALACIRDALRHNQAAAQRHACPVFTAHKQ
ncbi:hypothetical protein PSA5_26580 [Pseudomonas syringae pv. actinidiae]|nr:hypothetical protein PSA5_26580 [Pseudomonas syringae pv. actinidiae]